MSIENPCLTCGACCAHFRVSFYWAEADPTQAGDVPAELTEPLPPFHSCMKGTNQPHPHCVALLGLVGDRVACSIYDHRPSVCREFGLNWPPNGLKLDSAELERCNRARAAWNLPPLRPDSFVMPSPEPKDSPKPS